VNSSLSNHKSLTVLLFTGSGKPLSKPLSCKERGFEFSPFPPLRGSKLRREGGWGVRFDIDFSR